MIFIYIWNESAFKWLEHEYKTGRIIGNSMFREWMTMYIYIKFPPSSFFVVTHKYEL